MTWEVGEDENVDSRKWNLSYLFLPRTETYLPSGLGQSCLLSCTH